MTATPIQHILDHTAPLEREITIEGWVRSRRTSKGGFSFIHVNDGSCMDSVQAVADGALPNYTDEILEIGTGCAVRINGTLVESGGKGQDREIQASQRRGAWLGG